MNVYDDKHISGIIVNKISDHQTIFTGNNRRSPLCMESKYMPLGTKDKLSLGKFSNIMNHLNQDTFSDPNENYDKSIEMEQYNNNLLFLGLNVTHMDFTGLNVIM